MACEALGNFAFRNPGASEQVACGGTAPALLTALAPHASDHRVAESAMFALSALPSGSLGVEDAAAVCACARDAGAAHPTAKRLQRWVRDVLTAHDGGAA